VVNVTGSFLIGLMVTLLTDWPFSRIRTGGAGGRLPGGYTTFSTFEFETYASIRMGGFWIGVANVMGSVGLLCGRVAGAMLGRR
jgi:fluoride ion exporter CrcB/FEX